MKNVLIKLVRARQRIPAHQSVRGNLMVKIVKMEQQLTEVAVTTTNQNQLLPK